MRVNAGCHVVVDSPQTHLYEIAFMEGAVLSEQPARDPARWIQLPSAADSKRDTDGGETVRRSIDGYVREGSGHSFGT